MPKQPDNLVGCDALQLGLSGLSGWNVNISRAAAPASGAAAVLISMGNLVISLRLQ